MRYTPNPDFKRELIASSKYHNFQRELGDTGRRGAEKQARSKPIGEAIKSSGSKYKQGLQVNTGHYIRSFYSKSNSDGSVLIGNSAKYAAFIEYGTKPHIIRAKYKPMLVFYSPNYGWTRKKEVMHTGTRSYYVLRDGVIDNLKYRYK